VRLISTVLAATAVAAALAAPLRADEPPLYWHLNGGWTPTIGTTADFLDSGYTVGAGLTWNPLSSDSWALQTDLAYSSFNATSRLINLGASAHPQVRVDDGHATVWQLTVGGRYYLPMSTSVRVYGIGGIGVYKRDVKLTQTVLIAGGWCDWYGFCYSGVVPGDVVVSSQDTTKFGWNVGIGLEYRLEYGAAWFLEARYHSIETPHRTEFVPISIGFRF
jgi:opacity protein-like surface antigen